jgi:hypothetical protein
MWEHDEHVSPAFPDPSQKAVLQAQLASSHLSHIRIQF